MKSNLIKVFNSLNLDNVSPNSPLQKILTNALDDLNIHKRMNSNPNESYWDASYFGLDKVRIYKEMKDSQKEDVLRLCSGSLIEEATFVEKSATCFTSKMTLLSETTEERMLYSLFAAEEVAHYHAMLSYLPNEELPKKPNPFIALLNAVLEDGDKTTLTFIIQVVLEGWGLTHFAGLGELCREQDLKDTFRWFVKHEARHHGSGVLLFNQVPPSASQLEYIVEIMIEFLHMIQIGPQSVLASLMKIRGDLTLNDFSDACRAMDSEMATKTKLGKLKSLMHGEHSKIIVEKLDSYGAFTPLSSVDCARAFNDWIK